MRVYIFACEDRYQGLHGMYETTVVEVENIDEANEYGREMSYNVYDSYGYMWQDEIEDEEFDEEDDREEALSWYIFKIKDEFNNISTEELNSICSHHDFEYFKKKYCELIDF